MAHFLHLVRHYGKHRAGQSLELPQGEAQRMCALVDGATAALQSQVRP